MDSTKHGTISTYNQGCHCDLCREALRAYMKSYRASKRPPPECGTVQKYRAGCHCNACTQANTRERRGLSRRSESCGTINSYRNKRCRCQLCKRANADYMKLYRTRVEQHLPTMPEVPKDSLWVPMHWVEILKPKLEGRDRVTRSEAWSMLETGAEIGTYDMVCMARVMRILGLQRGTTTVDGVTVVGYRRVKVKEPVVRRRLLTRGPISEEAKARRELKKKERWEEWSKNEQARQELKDKKKVEAKTRRELKQKEKWEEWRRKQSQ